VPFPTDALGFELPGFRLLNDWFHEAPGSPATAMQSVTPQWQLAVKPVPNRSRRRRGTLAYVPAKMSGFQEFSMHKSIIATLAGAALIATPAIAQHAGHGSGSGPATTSSGQGPNASSNAGAHANQNSPVSTTTTTAPTDTTTTAPTDTSTAPMNGATTRDQAREKSQGPNNASPTGISHANENSVLAGGSVAADTLPGLTTGLNVQSSTGTSLGTVSQVITGSNGSIRMVVVTTPTGQTIRLPANSLSISGDVVTTTSTTTP
jgi:hypothetical protein